MPANSPDAATPRSLATLREIMRRHGLEPEFDELGETFAGLIWICKRNGLADDPYVKRAEEILNRD